MKRIVLVLLWVFVVVNCFGQNNEYRVKVEQDNRYHFQPSNVEYDPTSWIEAVSDNMERAKAGHQQGQNQIWSDLESINNMIKQGDYDNANLLIDRCIQLNTQWQYRLVDHNILIRKKNEIAEAKRKTSSQSYNNGYSQNNYNSGYNYNSGNSQEKNYTKVSYTEYDQYAMRFNTLVLLASEIVYNASNPKIGYDKKTAYFNARRMLVMAHGYYRTFPNLPLLKTDIYLYETVDELLTKSGFPPYEPNGTSQSQLDLKFTRDMITLDICTMISYFALYPQLDIKQNNVDKKTSYKISRFLLNKIDEQYNGIDVSTFEENALRKYFGNDYAYAGVQSMSLKLDIGSLRETYNKMDADLKKEGY